MNVDEQGFFYAKIHHAEGKVLVAICDEELLDKEFREGELVLSIPSSFYRGERVNLRRAIELILEADIAVVTGRRIVQALIKAGLATPESVLNIGGQLHLQIVKSLYEV